jgi:hypothetical protein
MGITKLNCVVISSLSNDEPNSDQDGPCERLVSLMKCFLSSFFSFFPHHFLSVFRK